MFHGDMNIDENPIESPPLEILKQGNQAVRTYFQSLEGEPTVTLNEIKVLLVGGGSAGKTSLLKQLQGEPFDSKESQTHGINVVTLPASKIPYLPLSPELNECQLHIWDFGGQEIMHASHQFFLSERALYILVVDSRTDEKIEKIYEWLKHIEKFGGESPLIVALNKIDLNPNSALQRNTLNRAYPNIQNRFERISCSTGEGLEFLFRTLVKTIPETSLFGTPIAESWMKVKENLVEETAQNNYIDRSAFEAICCQHGVDDSSSQQTLLTYLHDLGIVLYFKQLNLANIYVLDPHWVTIGVYKIINSHAIPNGLLKEFDLNYILNEEPTKKKEYDPAKEKEVTYTIQEQSYLLNIMRQFELCYPLDEQQGHYIVPNLLPKELDNEPVLPQGKRLRFVISYDFLPASIMPRLMIKLKNDIHAGAQWRYGMMLHHARNGCWAKVVAHPDKKTIIITVVGEETSKRDYFSAILHAVREINDSFEKLEIKEAVPLPGYPDNLVKYSTLLGHERAGKTHYFDGDLGEEFPVANLLDSYFSHAEREHDSQALRGGSRGYVQYNFYGDNTQIGDNTTVGNVTNSQGVVVGRESEASVNQSSTTLSADERVELEHLRKRLAELEQKNDE